MKKKLFLDDSRHPKMVYGCFSDEWHLVKSYYEFRDYLNSIATSLRTEDMPEEVSFDYVLEDQYGGDDCAKFLVEFCIKYGLKMPKCYVHSSYSNATELIQRAFKVWKEKTGEEIKVERVYHHA